MHVKCNTMKSYLPVFACLVLVSCSEEYLLERKEDKLIGVWEFECVYYRPDNALFRDNVSSEFEHDIIEFLGDYTAYYDDYSLGVVFPGDWIIRTDYDYAIDGGGGTEFFVDAMFYGMFQDEDFGLFGSIDRLNNRTMRLEGRDRRGTYTYHLVRR